MLVYQTITDDESSMDVLYLSAFKKMGLEIQYLKPTITKLHSFTNDSVVPMFACTHFRSAISAENSHGQFHCGGLPKDLQHSPWKTVSLN
ncbi:hypothetical protein PanWU01x14_067020 [Parasponia andersonii]|uniref:Uncharacterized protein n=1 Tax=Parasponia andersonii TaxID=3476 RepID=A0A2P5DGA9_PARAD|nr:hypothetical protein PanWU01x14_067020 [Parasponia andersonii]